MAKKVEWSKKIEMSHKRRGKRMCRICGNCRGLIRKYGLRMCRKCFRERAEQIGFRKYM
ncbi:MAG: 30S ribosomal protein S14 [Candidatus Micrarchaeota archaeon]|nr:30S ribosomal protein S14 [Candidatus Micrarchaeota archaeon]